MRDIPRSRPRRSTSTIVTRIAAAAIVASIAPATLRAQSPISNGDVPSAPGFAPGARALVHEDWANAPGGFFPPTIAVVAGSMSIVEERGRKFLRVNEDASFDLVLPGLLPEEYTIEFDMLVPRGTGYAVEVRPATPGEPGGYAGLSRRARNPVVTCGPIGSGVYGASLDATRRFDNALAHALVPCQIAVSAQGVRVFFAGEDAATVPNVSLGRTPRIRFHVPAMSGQEALIGPIRVSTSSGTPAAPAVASGNTAGAAPSGAGGGTGGGTSGGANVGTGGASGAGSNVTVTQSSGMPAPANTDVQPGAAHVPGTVVATGAQAPAPSSAPAAHVPGTVVATGAQAPTASSTPAAPGAGTRVPGQAIGSAGAPQTVTRTPASAAASLRQQGKSVKQAAEQLEQEYGLPLGDIVKALAGGGYPLHEIALWLKRDHAHDVPSVVELLKDAGPQGAGVIADAVWAAFVDKAGESFGPTGKLVVTTLRQKLNAAASDLLPALAKRQSGSMRDWAGLLTLCGYHAHETAEALRIALNLNDEGVADALRGQVSLEDLGVALASSFNTSAERYAELLRRTAPGVPVVPPAAIAKALNDAYKLQEAAAIEALRRAGFPTEALVSAMKDAYGSTPAQIVARLRSTQTTEALAAALKKQFPTWQVAAVVDAFRSAGAAADEIAPAVRKAYALGENALVQALITGKFDPTTVAGAMRVSFTGIKPETVAVALAAAGVQPGPLATAIIDAFELAAAAVATMLAGLGIQ